MDEESEEHLMSVLELLELQARARAIRSQLALENAKKARGKEQEEEKEKIADCSDVEDAIIIESPRNDEIVITSSDSETENSELNNKKINENTSTHNKCDNKMIIDIDDDANISYKQLVKTPSTSSNTKKDRFETSNNNDAEHIVNSASDPSSSSRLELISENPEDVNKLFNKFHKMKRQKRKLDEQEKINSAKQVRETKCNRKELAKLNKLIATIREKRSVKESSNQLDVSTYATSELKGFEIVTEESVVESQNISTDSQKTIGEDQHSVDGEDGIILNVDQAEIDSIISESEVQSSSSETGKSEATHTGNISDKSNEAMEVTNANNVESRIIVNQICTVKSENVYIKHIDNQEQCVKSITDETNQLTEEADGIILNVEQSELDSVNLDTK